MYIPPYTITTAPATGAVSIGEALAQCSIDGEHWNAFIDGKIHAATEHVEGVTGRALVTQTRTALFPRFMDVFYLPGAPIQSVSYIRGREKSGQKTDLTVSGWHLDANTGFLRQKSSAVIPALDLDDFDPVEIVYVCGYGAASAVPQAIKHAILLLVEHAFRNREAVTLGNTAAVTSIPLALGVDSFLSRYVLHPSTPKSY